MFIKVIKKSTILVLVLALILAGANATYAKKKPALFSGKKGGGLIYVTNKKGNPLKQLKGKVPDYKGKKKHSVVKINLKKGKSAKVYFKFAKNGKKRIKKYYKKYYKKSYKAAKYAKSADYHTDVMYANKSWYVFHKNTHISVSPKSSYLKISSDGTPGVYSVSFRKYYLKVVVYNGKKPTITRKSMDVSTGKSYYSHGIKVFTQSLCAIDKKGNTKGFTWSSSNSSIATVKKTGGLDSATVAGKKAGVCYAIAKKGKQVVKCKITVSKFGLSFKDNSYQTKLNFKNSLKQSAAGKDSYSISNAGIVMEDGQSLSSVIKKGYYYLPINSYGFFAGINMDGTFTGVEDLLANYKVNGCDLWYALDSGFTEEKLNKNGYDYGYCPIALFSKISDSRVMGIACDVRMANVITKQHYSIYKIFNGNNESEFFFLVIKYNNVKVNAPNKVYDIWNYYMPPESYDY